MMDAQPWKKRFSLPSLPWHVGVMIAIAALIFLLCSSVRHGLFQSSALDLGYFDQAIYLISQGLPPIVSFWGYHVMGGHADWIIYGIAGLYKLYPSIYWLFAIQAIALAMGALPSWHLARQARLAPPQATAIALVYLLYPLVFNLNLFDFHPEVIALPLLLSAVLAARGNRVGWFTLCIILSLGCRDALSLTIAAMGLWLIAIEKKGECGAIALSLGTAWFLIATQAVIPHFRPGGVESVSRYAYLGESLFEVIANIFLKPHLVFSKVFSLDTLVYLLFLVIPLAWGLSVRHLLHLLPAVPTLAMNILSDLPSQRDLLHQYSLPALPFLLLVAIASLAANHTWIKQPRWIVLWSLVAFLALAKYEFFGSKYLTRLDSWQATREAIALIQTSDQTLGLKESVLTTSYIAPHLTHRARLEYTKLIAPPRQLDEFRYVLLNLQDPGWASSPELAQSVLQTAQSNPQFRLEYQRDRVYLFVQQP
ncbi:DUF2079 domain-containing protein [Myxacorys almedinensis]|nr:DUF2079 domain-containing protein [Myxacorys almedinensis]